MIKFKNIEIIESLKLSKSQEIELIKDLEQGVEILKRNNPHIVARIASRLISGSQPIYLELLIEIDNNNNPSLIDFKTLLIDDYTTLVSELNHPTYYNEV